MNNELGLDDELPIGKYKGDMVSWVIENDSSYLIYMQDEGILSFDEEVLQKL